MDIELVKSQEWPDTYYVYEGRNYAGYIERQDGYYTMYFCRAYTIPKQIELLNALQNKMDEIL